MAEEDFFVSTSDNSQQTRNNLDGKSFRVEFVIETPGET